MLGLIGPLGGWELLALAVIGLLIFGKRLPEVGKSLGKGIVEFKKGLSGIEEEINDAGASKPKDEQVDQATSQQLPPAEDATTTLNQGEQQSHKA